MSHYVYVGVPQWTATESAGLLGGLFRQEIGASAWQHLTSRSARQGGSAGHRRSPTGPASTVCRNPVRSVPQRRRREPLGTPGISGARWRRVDDRLSSAESAGAISRDRTAGDLSK